jgi:dihydroflavonol-4-reductase
VFATGSPNLDALETVGAEVHWGDVSDLESFGHAFAECDVVVHLAAGTSGTARDCETGTLQGTRNLLGLCRRHRPAKLVYVSSCSVHGIAASPRHAVTSESGSLQRFSAERGDYSASKLRAEGYLRDYLQSDGIPVVVFRPAAVYGPGEPVLRKMLGCRYGRRVFILSNREFGLPLVYVDNIVDAIVRSIERAEANGQIFSVADSAYVTKREYVDNVIRRVFSGVGVVYVPYRTAYSAAWVQEFLLTLLRRPPFLTRYRLTTSQKSVVYDHGRLAERSGWQPHVSSPETLAWIVSIEAVATSTGTGEIHR